MPKIDEVVESQKMYFLSFWPVESLRVERRKPESSLPEVDQVVGTNMASGFHRSDDFLRLHQF
jgi:hypothetical protein